MTHEIPVGRLVSVDAFRGLAIMAMIFVNELAAISGVPAWARHADADADTLTFVDVVFPAFLFIVGMSMAAAIAARRARGDTKADILRHGAIRGTSLVLIGVFMVNAESGFDAGKMLLPIDIWMLLAYACIFLIWGRFSPDSSQRATTIMGISGLIGLATLALLYVGDEGRGLTPQWWGILGLIGWAYLLVLPICLATERFVVLSVSMILYAAFFVFLNTDVGSATLPSWLTEFRGNFTHAAIVLFGVILSILVFENPLKRSAYIVGVSVTLISIVLAFVGWAFAPISKIYATPAWAFFSTSICTVLFIAIYTVTENGKMAGWVRLFMPSARNALLIYLIPYVLAATLLAAQLPLRPAFFASGIIGVFYCVGFTMVIMLVGWRLAAAGVRLKL